MNRLFRVIGSVLVGVLATLVVGVAVTAALDPYIWPSLLVGLPAGLAAGAVATALSFLGSTYWRATDPETAATARRRFLGASAATAGFVAGAVLATGVLVAGAVGVTTAMVVGGLPTGLIAAVLAARVTTRRSRRNAGRPVRDAR